MKKKYLTPLTDFEQMDGEDQLLSASLPATGMEMPDKNVNKNDGIWDDPDSEEDDWGF